MSEQLEIKLHFIGSFLFYRMLSKRCEKLWYIISSLSWCISLIRLERRKVFINFWKQINIDVFYNRQKYQLKYVVLLSFFLSFFLSLFLSLVVFDATFNNISVISWWSVLLVEETWGSGENHRPVTSHWQTLSHNIVHLTLIEVRTHNFRSYRHWLHM